MRAFDRFADWVARVWEQPYWFAACAVFVCSWVVGLLATRKWNDSAYHLWLNSPTTALTFLGVFLLHNSTQRFERATNKRLEKIMEAGVRRGPGAGPGPEGGERSDMSDMTRHR